MMDCIMDESKVKELLQGTTINGDVYISVYNAPLGCDMDNEYGACGERKCCVDVSEKLLDELGDDMVYECGFNTIQPIEDKDEDYDFDISAARCKAFYGVDCFDPKSYDFYEMYKNAPPAPVFSTAKELAEFADPKTFGTPIWIIDLDIKEIFAGVTDFIGENDEGKPDIVGVYSYDYNGDAKKIGLDQYYGKDYGKTWLASPMPYYPTQWAKKFGH